MTCLGDYGWKWDFLRSSFHYSIPWDSIPFLCCFFYGIFILWYLGCVLFLQHNIWCVITSTRKECSLCGNQYLILCFLYVLDALLSLQVDLINLIVAFSYLFYIHFPCPRLLDDNYNIIQGIVVMVDNGNNFMKVIGPLDQFVVKVLGQVGR